MGSILSEDEEKVKESQISENFTMSEISQKNKSPQESELQKEQKESKQDNESDENPKIIKEDKVEEKKNSKDNKEIVSIQKKAKIVNIEAESEDDKNSIEPIIIHYPQNDREEEKSNENVKKKIEESKENKYDDFNDLTFPIITFKKPEESKNSECDSLSALNNALAKNQIDFYNMNLKIPDNLPLNNKFSNQVPTLVQTSIINPLDNSGQSAIPNYFIGFNPLSKNTLRRKFHNDYNFSQFFPITISCSIDTHNSRKYRSKFVENEKEFFNKIIKIADVKNITEFWEVFQHLKKPDQCPIGTDYHVFKKGIVPMWEDNMNKDGGKLSVLLTWKYANLIWEEVVFNFSKGLLPYYIFINGIVISLRPKFLVLSFWVKTKNNSIVEKIRNALSNMLQTPSNNCFDFIAFNSSEVV